jgi:two-component system, chemotaxis family, sensor kinase CheA
VTQFSDDRVAEMRELFFESAQELLQALNEDALQLEKRPDDGETVRAIRRTVHTLKGDAAACGFRELSQLAHELEDALALEPAPASGALAEVAFTAADAFSAMLASYRSSSVLPSGEPLRKLVRALAESPGQEQPRRKKSKTRARGVEWTEYERLAAQNALSSGQYIYHVKVEIDPGCAMPIAARQLLLNAVAPLGELLGTRPEAGSTQPVQSVELLLASRQGSDQIAAKCHIPTVSSNIRVETVWYPDDHGAAPTGLKAAPASAVEAAASEQPGGLPSEEPAAGPKPHSAHSAADNVLRVEAARIDNVLNLVGELIIGKSMLQQVLNEFARVHPKDTLRGRFADALAFQARVLNDLQRSVMKVRMVPVEQLFRRFPRMVRDVAKQCGKNVELLISGKDTDLDKSLLDAIAEPIAHLVRNAVSHGIEDSAERARTGKPAGGVIRFDAYHQGNQVVVEIADDGRGLDLQAIKTKAIERGLVSRDEAARLREADLLDLVFRPGFSTATEITAVSGRGVGLDVVQSVMQRLKGAVEIRTQPGQGTTFLLKLPLTLAIIKALLFRVEQRLYAIPLNAVAEIARARESDLHQVDHYEVLQLRGQVLQLVRLGRPRQLLEEGHGKIFVLVIALGDRKLGLIVDSLEGEEELVIKALDDQTIEADLVAGASILGDGRVVLILNLAAIMERCTKAQPSGGERVPYGLLLSHADRARLRANAAGGQT